MHRKTQKAQKEVLWFSATGSIDPLLCLLCILWFISNPKPFSVALGVLCVAVFIILCCLSTLFGLNGRFRRQGFATETSFGGCCWIKRGLSPPVASPNEFFSTIERRRWRTFPHHFLRTSRLNRSGNATYAARCARSSTGTTVHRGALLHL